MRAEPSLCALAQRLCSDFSQGLRDEAVDDNLDLPRNLMDEVSCCPSAYPPLWLPPFWLLLLSRYPLAAVPSSPLQPRAIWDGVRYAPATPPFCRHPYASYGQ